MERNIVTLDDDLKVLAEYEVNEEQVGEFDRQHIPKSISYVVVVEIIEGGLDDLCYFIESQKGNFYDLLETKILEMED